MKFGIVSLSKNYNRDNLEENIPDRSGGDTSYVIDKGTTFAMCLRDPKNDNKLDTNHLSLLASLSLSINSRTSPILTGPDVTDEVTLISFFT